MKTSTVLLLMASVISAPHLNKHQAMVSCWVLYVGVILCLLRGD